MAMDPRLHHALQATKIRTRGLARPRGDLRSLHHLVASHLPNERTSRPAMSWHRTARDARARVIEFERTRPERIDAGN
jgi:hypothetical protein